MEQDFNKKQNKKLTIFACILSVLSIGLLIFGFMAVSSNKVVLLQSLSNLSSKLDPFLEENHELLDKIASSNDVGFNTSISVDINELISQSLSFDLDINYLENKNDKKSKLDLELSSVDEQLLDAKVILANQNLYGFINDITPRYYYTSFDYESFLSSLSSKDSEKIWSLFKDTINDYIENDSITKEKVVIKYNDKDKKVNKLSYAISSKDIKEIISNFFDELKKDKTLFNNISSLINFEGDDLQTEIDTFLDSLEVSDNDELIYNVYYYGFNKIVQYEFGTTDNSFLVQYKVGKVEEIKLFSNDKMVFSLNITRDKKQYNFDGYLLIDDTKLPFSGSAVDNSMNITFNTDSGDLKLDIFNISDNNNFIYTSTIKLTVTTSGVSVDVGTLEVKSEYSFNKKIDVSLDNSVEVNEISEDDYNIIYENILKHPFYSILESFIDMDFDDFDISL